MATSGSEIDPARRRLREISWLGGGLLAAFAIGAGIVYFLTQTDAGRQKVLAFTLARLGTGIEGQLAVREIDGNLLTGAKLYGVSLRARSGEPFVIADSAYLRYNARTLVTARIELQELVLYDPEIYVSRAPSDTLWNYQKIFPPSGDTTAAPRITLVDRVRVVNGFVRVELPWLPDSTLSRPEQAAELREALSDSSELMVRRVEGGYLRRMEGADVQGTLSRVRFAPGSEPGSFVGVDRLAGRVRFFRTPFRLSRVRGEIAVLSDRVEFRAPDVLLNRTPLVTAGVIHPGESGEEPRYDVVFQSDSVSLGDFRWLYPRFPEEAHGALTLRIETRPEGTLFLAREVRLRAPGTRLSGNFGMIAGDTLRFVEVDLRADPLRVSMVEEMLPEGLPVTGLRIGAVEIVGEAGSPPLTRQR